MKEAWEPYQKALSFYNECLSHAEFERLPANYNGDLNPPNWLDEYRIDQIAKEVEEYQQKELKRLSRSRQNEALTRRIVRYRAQDMLYRRHNIEIEQLNIA